jgi:hypothetical protein
MAAFVDPLLGAAISYGAGKTLTAGARGMYGLGKRAFGRSQGPAAKRRTLNQAIRQQQRQAYLSKNRRTGGLIDIEKKFLDKTSNTTLSSLNIWVDLSPSGTISCPAEGNGAQERDGRVFFIHSVHIKGYVLIPRTTAPLTADIAGGSVRIVLVWDTQTNGAAVVGNDVFEPNGADTSTRFRNLEHSSRFIILKDKLITFSPDQDYDGTQWQIPEKRIPFKMNKTFKKPIKVRTSGTASDVASVTDNNLALIASQSVNSPLTPSVYWNSRIRFTG